MKYTKRLQGFLPLGIILIVIYLILTFTETGSESFCGFGVDSSGKIYVGRFHTIEVYENRELVHTIPSPTNRGWEMTVSQNDEIIIANGSDVYTLKLDGTIVCKEEDYQSETVYKIKKQRELFDAEGNIYRLNGFMGYKWISKNNKIVYMLPIIDVITRISLVLGCISFAIGLFVTKLKPGTGEQD